MVKRMLTLTLIGLMTAMLFPVCANAQVQPTNLIVDQNDDSYNTQPTLRWVCASGPTIFKITVKDKDDTPIGDAATVDAGTITDGKWDDRTANQVGDTDTYAYNYGLSSELNPGAYTWDVVAEREDAKTGKTDGYVADPVASDSEITVLGAITLSLVADKAEAGINETVTVTVSMDNSTNGEIPTDTLSFNIAYDGDVVTAPSDATPLGNASGITPTVDASGSGDAAKATVTLDGEIAAGTGDIVSLEFTVANAGSNTFVLVDDIAITSTVDPPVGSTTNPSVVGGESQPLTVNAIKGDLDGDNKVGLTDAVIALKVLTGLDIAGNETAVAKHEGKVDAGLLVFILGNIITP